MNNYHARSLEGASGVELVIALYDGILRFMNAAIAAVDAGDVSGRRTAVKRAMDIVIHLQATLRPDVGGKPAEALTEFYASMFALMLQGSQANSREKFEQVIAYVWNVRDAWRQVADDPTVRELASTGIEQRIRSAAASGLANDSADAEFSSSWSA